MFEYLSVVISIFVEPKYFQRVHLLIFLARMAEDLFVRPDGKPMTFLMGSSEEKKQVQIIISSFYNSYLY